MKAFSLLTATLVSLATAATALSAPPAPARLDSYDVVWKTHSTNSAGSMPLGNGDIALNAWVEPNGDLRFYIAKCDAWSGDLTGPPYGAYGLIKVGRIRVSFSPNPFADRATFSQTLALRDGQIELRGGTPAQPARLLLRVDANHPLIRVEATTPVAATMRVTLEPWRTEPTEYLAADTILPAQGDRITWFYRGRNRDIPQLVNRTIGAAARGDLLTSENATTLVSRAPATTHALSVHPLTAQTETPEAWIAKLNRQIAATDAVPPDEARRRHAGWWSAFWERSWIFVTAGEKAEDVTRGYLLQRFKHACTSRGEFPIKFNGSLFNVDHPKRMTVNDKVKGKVEVEVTADYRGWGHQYWFQNTRHMYWPMMMSGDFDLMQPLFRMYSAMLPGNTRQVREFYGHNGAYFRETGPFWGGLNKVTPEEPGGYTKHYYTPILELSAMMLDYFDYTGDTAFLKTTLLPMADAGVTFYDEHFKRGPDGKLLIQPANAIEMFWKVRDPLPDIAGLRWVLQGLLDLPSHLTDPAARKRWQRLLGEVPEIPIGEVEGIRRILPYAPGQQAGRHNSENPELYAVYPFRLYGVGKPELPLAQATFTHRKYKKFGCWYQDAIQGALVGDAATAQKGVIRNLTNRDSRMRFQAFWAKGHDYIPDEDNGGNGLVALQQMLLQADDGKILLLPAWPADWEAEFKLHAPGNTQIQGRVSQGKVLDLKVTPEKRRADIVFPAAR